MKRKLDLGQKDIAPVEDDVTEVKADAQEADTEAKDPNEVAQTEA